MSCAVGCPSSLKGLNPHFRMPNQRTTLKSARKGSNRSIPQALALTSGPTPTITHTHTHTHTYTHTPITHPGSRICTRKCVIFGLIFLSLSLSHQVTDWRKEVADLNLILS